MNPACNNHRLSWLRSSLAALLSMVLLGMPAEVQALCGLDDAFRDQLSSVKDPEAVQFDRSSVTCSACHLGGGGGPRNEYGNALNTLLTISDREDPVRLRDAGRRMKDILANPLSPDSPTFGELIEQGRLPASSLTTQMPPLGRDGATSRSHLQARPDSGDGPDGPGDPSHGITAEQACDLVQQVEAESHFGILQLSRTYETTPEVATALAEFRGEILILGLKSLTPEVAAALAKSQAQTVWLHSITSVSPEVAAALVRIHGHLVLTSLAELDSVPLAEKLADRPGALSFPYLTKISPEIAEALARNMRSLSLAGLTDVSPEVQEKLAETVGALSLPNLKALDSVPLTKKLASRFVLLPKVEKLTVEQAKLFAEVEGAGSFFGGLVLSVEAMTPEVAQVFATTARPINLTLVGKGPVSAEVLRTLLGARLNLVLQGVEELNSEQVRIVADALAGTMIRSGLNLPNLKKLDSPLLAETLAKRSGGGNFPGVTRISPEAAAALGSLPDEELKLRDGTVRVRPSGHLSFPSLTELSPETARLLLKKRWASISLPSVQEISLETIRSLARQTSNLTLGITALPPEFAGAFAETPIDTDMGGGAISFPRLKDLSPEAARILVKSLNRGIQVNGQARISKTPSLQFGTVLGSLPSGFTLSPETAVELAKYEGSLSLQGLGELPDDSARALSSFNGVYLSVSGPAAERLTPDAAAALAKTPATLKIPLKVLDSVPLAERFAWQYSRSFYAIESISKESIPALIKYQQIFDVRKIAVLDSPELVRRYLQNSWGPTLPALTTISPEAAEIVVTSPYSILLGLTVLDSPTIARTLTKAEKGVKLPRLRAATPEVIEILKEAKSIETPPLESVYVLSESHVRP